MAYTVEEVEIRDDEKIPEFESKEGVYRDDFGRPTYVFTANGDGDYDEVHYTYESDPDDEWSNGHTMEEERADRYYDLLEDPAYQEYVLFMREQGNNGDL